MTLTQAPLAEAVPLSNPNPTCVSVCTIDFTYQSANYYAWTAPVSGTYTFQAWGAQGGGGESNFGTGGAGGYSKGDYAISAGSVIYVYIGQQGIHSGSTSLTAYNGGGAGNPASPLSNSGFSGGGATHAALSVGLLSALSSAQSDLLIVAGGGGGAAGATSYFGVGYAPSGGAGGGTSGGTPVDSSQSTYRGKGLPGTQLAGGTSGLSGTPANDTPVVAAGFGVGASASSYTGDAIQGGGGGGGFYGGGAGGHAGGAGAGGSGFVGNLTNTTISSGATSFIQPDGTTASGRLGNGYLRITYPNPVVNFNGYSLSGEVKKSSSVTVTASVDTSSRITFLANGKRIGGCISKLTTGSGPYTAQCQWKPTTRGNIKISFYVVPVGGLIAPITSPAYVIAVGNRAGYR